LSKSFIIENENGMRIDKCLAEMPSGLSRSHIQKLIKEGDIMVNDKPVKANYRLISGDHVTINIPNLKEPDIAAEDIPLDIKVAVMGCAVNGPGEAKEADIGIAGGIGEGLLIKKGEVIKKVREEELLETLRWELLHWNE